MLTHVAQRALKLAAVCVVALAMAACSKPAQKAAAPAPEPPAAPAAPSAEAIHAQTLVLDSHVDLELELIADDMDPWSSGKSKLDLDKMDKGGMTGPFLIVFTPQGEDTEAGLAKARKIAQTRYAAIMRLMQKYPERIELATTSADARRIKKAGKHFAFIGMENPYPLGHSVAEVPLWAKRGVRYMGITHMGHNQFGDSANPSYAKGEKKSLHGGLSPLGRELIAAINKAGIMVDVSHAAKSTMMQAVALSKVPVIASHSGVRALADNVRNLDDEQLHALADKGGVIQIVAYGGYLKDLTPAQKEIQKKVRQEMGLVDDMAFLSMDDATEKIYDEKMKAADKLSPPANVSDLVDHIDYVVKTVGIDHVGIASDFDGGGGIDGWKDASQTLNVTKELVKRGYSADDIAKIWGGNLLRVLDEAEAWAQKQP